MKSEQKPEQILEKAEQGLSISNDEALSLARYDELDRLMQVASALRDQGHGTAVTYSAKIFIPLTRYCQDKWDYCSFPSPCRRDNAVYLSVDDVLEAVRVGAAQGCCEVLFFLAAKPEQFSEQAKAELQEMGYDSTLDYLAVLARRVFEETGLLPKLHSGVLNRAELLELRQVSVAQGLMLDSRADFLCEEGETFYGEPDQHPYVRLGVVAAAGAMAVPFTSGIVIGTGESRRERIDSLLALRELNQTYYHLQEIVVQDIRRAPHGRISKSMLQELLWTVAIARLIHGPEANIQAPGDLPLPALTQLLDAGINDWGCVSPLVSAESCNSNGLSQFELLTQATLEKGKKLEPRLPVYSDYTKTLGRWIDSRFHTAIRSLCEELSAGESAITIAERLKQFSLQKKTDNNEVHV